MSATVMALARAERSDLADLLDSLGPDRWLEQSLCQEWSVHDVVAHTISYEEHGRADLLRRFRRAVFRPGRINDAALADYRDMTNDQLPATVLASPAKFGTPLRHSNTLSLGPAASLSEQPACMR
ncbi:maleylpyruvate isomerase family mycothiol-dependent enzyme [Rhodococcus sp. NPDC058521]|uniref:maleylpyruvate isomerase family mycothiol-dependent enzyme n=1 Tax=Rhodococcus sp. NPDC058521 TaxID=3346536 RepID=UPI00364B1558